MSLTLFPAFIYKQLRTRLRSHLRDRVPANGRLMLPRHFDARMNYAGNA
jgi:hypothetical protein